MDENNFANNLKGYHGVSGEILSHFHHKESIFLPYPLIVNKKEKSNERKGGNFLQKFLFRILRIPKGVDFVQPPSISLPVSTSESRCNTEAEGNPLIRRRELEDLFIYLLTLEEMG